MKIGLMWYDDDPKKTVEKKIEQAVARYREKYGRAPNACYVHPAAGAPPGQQHGLRVITARTIQPNYFWVGVDDSLPTSHT